MSLHDDLSRLLTLTDQLSEALRRDDLETCQQLSDERQCLLVELEQARQKADPSELDSLRPLAAELQRRDAVLQEDFQKARDSVQEDLTRQQAQSRPQGPVQAPLCINRKV